MRIKKGISLPVNVVVILIIAVIAMVVFLLFYFGILSFTQTSISDIETGTIGTLEQQARDASAAIIG